MNGQRALFQGIKKVKEEVRLGGFLTFTNRSLEGSEKWTDVIWFIFIKAHSGSCVKNRLQDAGVEARSPV